MFANLFAVVFRIDYYFPIDRQTLCNMIIDENERATTEKG